MIDCEGEEFLLGSLSATNPSKFALEFLRKVKGPTYIKSIICEPMVLSKTTKTAMDCDTVASLKSKF